eukprot:scaffold32803_cov33-Phaeocystis_antarctica.AAC.1
MRTNPSLAVRTLSQRTMQLGGSARHVGSPAWIALHGSPRSAPQRARPRLGSPRLGSPRTLQALQEEADEALGGDGAAATGSAGEAEAEAEAGAEAEAVAMAAA